MRIWRVTVAVTIVTFFSTFNVFSSLVLSSLPVPPLCPFSLTHTPFTYISPRFYPSVLKAYCAWISCLGLITFPGAFESVMLTGHPFGLIQYLATTADVKYTLAIYICKHYGLFPNFCVSLTFKIMLLNCCTYLLYLFIFMIKWDNFLSILFCLLFFICLKLYLAAVTQ